MDFTFGIITCGGNDGLISQIIDSIEFLNIPNYEIIIVGKCELNRKNTNIVPFNENIVPMWITRKKNTITSLAKYENIVYLHDYIKFLPDWYNGFLNYGNNFQVCMTKVLGYGGERFRDWLLCHEDASRIGVNKQYCLLPYNVTNLSKYQYISGAYWVAKKHIMVNYPLNEGLVWEQGEDVEWSRRYREHNHFSINELSTVQLMKPKGRTFDELTDEETLNRLKGI
jgi:hypothetical protein